MPRTGNLFSVLGRAALLAAICVAGCDEGAAGGPEGNYCPPGGQVPCTCLDGSQGVRACATGAPPGANVCQCGFVATGDAGSTGHDPGWTPDPGIGMTPQADAGGPLGTQDASSTGMGPGWGQDAAMASDAGIEAGDDAATPVPVGDDDVLEGCDGAPNWDPAWAQFEQEVLVLTNEARAVGHNCDTEGNFGPAEPLAMQPQLRCAARLHSRDMVLNGYFSHTGQDGRSPFQRMEAAGYSGGLMGENIASGQRTPREVVDGWLDSDGHCRNIMTPDFTEIGIGYYYEPGSGFWGNSHMWTQNFGAPLPAGGGWPWARVW